MCAMPGFSKMFSLLQRRRNANSAPNHSPATKAGYFGLLPPELTQLIVTSLSPSSAASLALTSHTLLHILGTQHFLCLEPDSWEFGPGRSETMEDRAIFLTGLIRDLPAGSGFNCYHCHKVHLLPLKKRRVVCMETKVVEELWTSKHERIFDRVNKSVCQWNGISYNYSTAETRTVYHDKFFFEHVQMAMQLHQRGSAHTLKGYLALLSLKSEQVIDTSLSRGSKGFRFYFFEPRIADNEMMIRAQTWLVMPYNDRINIHKQFKLPKFRCNATVCAHLGVEGSEENRLTQALHCRLDHARYQTSSPCCPECSGMLQCPMCPTEVQVGTETFYVDKSKTRRVIILVITKWQLVGDGTSPYEERWANPLSKGCDPWPWPKGDSAFNIKDTYENQPGKKFDSILDARKAWKLVKRYQNNFEVRRTV